MARQSVKQANALAKALALFAAEGAKAGITLDTSQIEAISPQEIKERQELAVREADGVLLSLHYPHKMAAKACRYCGETFMTNYCSVGYCSQDHRKKDLKRYGIKWNYDRGEIWGDYEPPLVITPATVDLMESWARHFLSDVERLRSQIPDQLKETPPVAQQSVPSAADLEEQEVLARQALSDSVYPSIPDPTEDDDFQAILPSQHESQDDLVFDF